MQILSIHPEHPQQRLIMQALKVLSRGGILAYPTDSVYALGCRVGDKEAMDRIRSLRRLDKHYNFTLMCRDLSEISQYATINNVTFRSLRAHTPGPFTFILTATKEVPRRLQHPKHKTVGISVPENAILQALLSALNEPILSVMLQLPGLDEPIIDVNEAIPFLERKVDILIDGGIGSRELTSIIDLSRGEPIVVREGRGDCSDWQSSDQS